MSINHYIDHFWRSRTLYAYSLRTPEQELYDATKIRTAAGKEQNLSVYLAYFRYCLKNRDGIFHLLNGGPVILLLTLLAGIREPIYHIRGTIYWDNAFQRLYLKMAWRLVALLRNVRTIIFIANSEHSAAVFRKEVLPVQPQVIYNGFRVEDFASNRKKRTQLRKIGYAGRLHSGKNVELVIRLFEEIASQMPETELHIAGEGPLMSKIRLQVDQSPFRERIHLHGFVHDMADFFASLDLLLFLSAYESFGNVLAEALLTGLPVLTSDIPAFQEIYDDEAAFNLGNPSYYETLHTRFKGALQNYQQLAQKAFQTSQKVEQKFNIDKHLEALEEIYARH